ncbi:YIP1 family protein [Methanosphaerula palustris]|uniref:Yip1 domain-containing protein n=1 Tax=Methanosphaerula palustris (strain ATCC BAA-1556 / DSM 19958 / E1-9c) TaxID=521011 RepID=B8GKR6_METPE|nr:Yip1 family protein [Methanosphaerula palustris]ACL17212.1 hypothetical protein Mpal_1907 [Methanosphaerula palustris E1-9c]
MSIPFITTIKGMTIAPVQTLLEQKETTIQDMLLYYLEISLAFSLLCTIVAGLLSSVGVTTAVDLQVPVSLLIYPVTLFAGMIISLVIMVLVFHGCARIVGGDGEWTDTLRAVALSSTPAGVIGWVPIVGSIIADIWSLVLMIAGVRDYHHLTTRRAAIAVLLPVGVIFVLGILAAAYLMVGSSTLQMPS